MNNNTVKVAIFLVMAFLAFKSLSSGLKSFSRKPAGPAVPEVDGGFVASGTDAKLSQRSSLVSERKSDKSARLDTITEYGRMPFMPAPQKAPEDKNVEEQPVLQDIEQVPALTTILQYQGKWFAVIDGKLFKAGDEFKGMRILEVTKNTVKVSRNRQITTLKLWAEKPLF
ncbi:MAG: hypothetical protein V1863_00740 [Candidatus Omnitrophota bacterium]